MPRDILYYDGYCGLCRGGMRTLKELDWLGRLSYQDLNTTPESELPVPMDEALRGIPMRTRDGRVLVGFPAMRRAMMQTPLLVGVAWLLYLPGISAVGDHVYRLVASRRRRACALPPPGWRARVGPHT